VQNPRGDVITSAYTHRGSYDTYCRGYHYIYKYTIIQPGSFEDVAEWKTLIVTTDGIKHFLYYFSCVITNNNSFSYISHKQGLKVRGIFFMYFSRLSSIAIWIDKSNRFNNLNPICFSVLSLKWPIANIYRSNKLLISNI